MVQIQEYILYLLKCIHFNIVLDNKRAKNKMIDKCRITMKSFTCITTALLST